MRFTKVGTRCRFATAPVVVAVAIAALAASAHARPGDLDPSFSRDGLIRASFGKYSYAGAVAIQPDGKIVVVGSTERVVAGSRVRRLLVARYRRGGRLDPAFSSNGKLSAGFGGARSAFAIALQPDGKIVVLGSGRRDSVLVRLHPGGTLDRSFSGDGWLVTDFGDYSFGDVALDDDGRIVLAGTRYGPGFSADAALARFQPDGARDGSFSGDGIAVASFAGYDYSYGGSVAIQSDGNLVLGGESSSGSDGLSDLALARFEPDGDPDSSFSGDGTTTLDGLDDYIGGVAVRSDGRIVAAESVCSPPDELYGGCIGRVAQFNPNGSLDDSFASGGVRSVSLRRGPYVGSVTDELALTDDGGTVLAGSTVDDRQGYGPIDFALVRLDATGSTDASFRGKGMWATDFLRRDDGVADVALQQDGKIVAAGSSYRVTAGRASRQVALARYEVTDGPRDADADGVRDRADRCRFRFGRGRHGCHLYRRSLTMELRRRQDLFQGALSSREPGCMEDQRIRVFRARHGRDFKVDTTRTDSGGGWSIDGRLHPGHYYAVAPSSLVRGYGRCSKARADGFRI